MSIPKYATKILSSGSEVEKQLMRDILSYIRSAYAYFTPDDTDTVAAIDAIIGSDYDETSPVAQEGSTAAASTGLSTVTFSLNSTPAIKFTLPEGADPSRYAFYIGGRRLATQPHENGKYIVMDVYAYAMCETVTYTIDGIEAGSYHIAAYHEWAKGQNNEALVNLVERF